MSANTEMSTERIETPAPIEGLQVLVFNVGGDEVAVEVARVREITRREEATSVPGLPPAVRGVVALRGGAIPVVDLAVRFGRPPSSPGPRSCIVVVEAWVGGELVDVGFFADDVCRVAALAAADIEPAPRLNPRLQLDFLAGIGRNDGKVLLLIDVERALDALDRACAPGAQVPSEALATQAEAA